MFIWCKRRICELIPYLQLQTPDHRLLFWFFDFPELVKTLNHSSISSRRWGEEVHNPICSNISKIGSCKISVLLVAMTTCINCNAGRHSNPHTMSVSAAALRPAYRAFAARLPSESADVCSCSALLSDLTLLPRSVSAGRWNSPVWEDEGALIK